MHQRLLLEPLIYAFRPAMAPPSTSQMAPSPNSLYQKAEMLRLARAERAFRRVM